MNVKRIWSEKRLGIALFLGIAILDIGLLVFGVLPLEHRLDLADEQMNSTAEGRRQEKITFNEIQNRISSAYRAEEDLDVFYETVLPTDARAAREILYQKISNRASAADLVLERRLIDREESPNGISQLDRLEATLRLTGRYRDIRRFIDGIETAEEFIVIETLALAPRTNVNEDTLILTMRLATYFLNRNSES